MAFGRPKSAGTVRPRSSPWISHGVDRNFTEFNNILKLSTLNKPADRPKTANGRLPILVTTPETDAPDGSNNGSSKHSSSHRLTQHVSTKLDKLESRTGYRVLAYKVDTTGKYIMLHDILDNTMYHCGTIVNTSFAKKASHVPLFDSKQSALSEKFPHRTRCDLKGVEKAKNNKYARVLASFDAWGKCQRRLGGTPAVIFEHAKFLNIVEFLDGAPPRQTPGRCSYKTFSYSGRPSKENQLN